MPVNLIYHAYVVNALPFDLQLKKCLICFVKASDDDDLDLFGDETEDEKKAAEEREAAVKASSKKKESKVIWACYLLDYHQGRRVT